MKKRLPDWPERLQDFLDQPHKFDWETASCALFAADAVQAITGDDPAAAYRGPKTAVGAYRRLLKLSNGVEDAATIALGQPKTIGLAQRGDIVSAEVAEGGEVALGVCVGEFSAFLSLPRQLGLVFIRTATCRKAWGV